MIFQSSMGPRKSKRDVPSGTTQRWFCLGTNLVAFNITMLSSPSWEGVGFSIASEFNLSTKDFVGCFHILHRFGYCLLEHRFQMKITCNNGCKLTLYVNKETSFIGPLPFTIN
jgi:hypothetical protein